MRTDVRRGAVAAGRDQFPVGMRVLAVDDDPVCLKVLETLLRRCQYHVTATNQAVIALRMLRENRDMFDLVISDVHMPDMDGFKLLELVGLEMDLPVIMLSVNGETKTVMKGITQGACDYLLKPVRIEELRNIWQHVIRKKFITRDSVNLDTYEEEGPARRGRNTIARRKMKTRISVVKTTMTLRLQRGQELFGQLNCIENLSLLSTILELTKPCQKGYWSS